MAGKSILTPANGRLYLIRGTVTMIGLWAFHVAGVSVAALNAHVNGQSDVCTKRLYILKMLLSR